jgi:hypothetical protein
MKETWEIIWKDYYKTLQIQPLSETVIIKGAFERLVLTCINHYNYFLKVTETLG